MTNHHQSCAICLQVHITIFPAVLFPTTPMPCSAVQQSWEELKSCMEQGGKLGASDHGWWHCEDYFDDAKPHLPLQYPANPSNQFPASRQVDL